jgi:hypothetical protein
MIPLSIELPLSPRCIRQVVTLFVLQIQSANPEPQRSGPLPVYLQLVPTLFCIHLRRCGCGRPVRISLFEARETSMPRVRNFDTEPPFSYYYELQPDHRLESVANAHTAADLRVRLWFLDRTDLKSRGHRE